MRQGEVVRLSRDFPPGRLLLAADQRPGDKGGSGIPRGSPNPAIEGFAQRGAHEWRR
jgi:hypothetical protein